MGSLKPLDCCDEIVVKRPIRFFGVLDGDWECRDIDQQLVRFVDPSFNVSGVPVPSTVFSSARSIVVGALDSEFRSVVVVGAVVRSWNSAYSTLAGSRRVV